MIIDLKSTGLYLRFLLVVVASVIMTGSAYAGDDDAKYQYYFQGAMIKYAAGDNDAAFDLLEYCSRLKPEASETYYYLALLHQDAGNDSLFVKMLDKAVALSPESVTYKEALIPVYLNANELDKASAIIEGIVHDTPERTDMLQLLLKIYMFQKDNAKALNVLDRLEVQEGQSEQLTMSKVAIYNNMGNEKEAYKQLKSLCDSHPLDLNYRVMTSNWLLGKDRRKEAYDILQQVLEEDPDNEDAQMSMMDYYRSEGKDSIAGSMREAMLVSPKTQQSSKILLLKQYLRDMEQSFTDSTVVLQLFDRILEQKQPDTQILELKLAYMTLKNMPSDSVAVVLQQILDMQPENAQARLMLIQLAWQGGKPEEMIRLALPAQEYNPEEWAFSYFLGVGYYLNDDKQKCIEALKVASQRLDPSKDKALASEMYSLMGDACYSIGKKAEAYEAYEKCLKLDPDKLSCLNNYAYYLSEENRDLDRAAAMSLKTIKAEPNNSTYLDTYAWILYLLERYEEAKIYIDMAVKNLDESQDNQVILDHQKAIDEKLNK